jgi:hypothetical protein
MNVFGYCTTVRTEQVTLQIFELYAFELVLEAVQKPPEILIDELQKRQRAKWYNKVKIFFQSFGS